MSSILVLLNGFVLASKECPELPQGQRHRTGDYTLMQEAQVVL